MTASDALDSDVAELFVLWTARETGVLDALTRTSGTVAGVAETADVSERATRVVVELLADRGYLERVRGEYEPTNRLLGFLATADVRSVGTLPYALDVLDALAALPETVHSGTPPDGREGRERRRAGATLARDEATVRACVTAATRAAPDAERVLDVGGAGVYATEFASRGFDVTTVQRPAVADAVAPVLEREPVELLAREHDALPDGFDLAFCAGASHRLGPGENRALVDALAGAVASGGAVVLADHRRSSRRAPVLAVEALATTERGGVYDAATVEDWLERAGLDGVRTTDVPGTDRQATVGRAHD